MKIIFYLFLVSFSIDARATIKLILERDASSAEFMTVGRPSALKIRGTKAKPEGQISVKGGSFDGEFLLNLSEFETGIGLRDKHMKEKYLEVEKSDFQKSKLKLKSLALPAAFWKNPTPQITSFKGMLYLHGVEREVEGQLEFIEANKSALLGMAKFSILLPDYGIAIPSFSGITVAEKVDLEIKFKTRIEGI